MTYTSIDVQKKRYRYLAYVVVRDSIAFYFGIPKFLEPSNLEVVHSNAYKERIQDLEKSKGRKLTDNELLTCRKKIDRSLQSRVRELQEDYEHCKQVLFEDNLWLQLLELNESFFAEYLPKLSKPTQDLLAVVPKLKTRDHSLGRPYINDNFNF